MSDKPIAFYLCHGGGPLPLLGDAAHQEMITALQAIAGSLPQPQAIVIVSAHWETASATLTAQSRPPLIYDYYGFPEQSYEIEYPCPGDPELAKQIQYALESAGIDVVMDHVRGFDHGVFVPLKIMYPNADIPVVQLSLLASLDPGAHVAVGRALQSLNKDGVLVVGSGFSFHNMEAFFTPATAETRDKNESFERWLTETCASTELAERVRFERLVRWSEAPGARFCHPREEHLLPLHVCYGVGSRACSQHYKLEVLGKKSSMFLWS